MDKTRGMTCRIMNDVTGMECRANGRRKRGWHPPLIDKARNSTAGKQPFPRRMGYTRIEAEAGGAARLR